MRILYLGFSRPDYSIDGIYIKGLRARGVAVIEYFFPQKKLGRIFACLKIFFSHVSSIDAVMVGYASPQLVIALWPFSRKPIIYNALCSEYERKIISRGLAAQFSLKGFYYWLLDFLSCRAASLVMLETEHQIIFFRNFFKAPSRVLFLARIGVNDTLFSRRADSQKYTQFTVLFRGRLLPEAGGEVAVKAAKLLDDEPIHFLMLANGMELPRVQGLLDTLKPRHFTLRTEFLAEDELIDTMQRCHLSLGQLSDHERLQRTIPHKAYESIALGLPYCTARNPAVMEIFTEGKTCIAFAPGDAEDLARAIRWAYHHQSDLEAIAVNGYRMYQELFTPQKLAGHLLARIESFDK